MLSGAYNAIGSAQIMRDYRRGRTALERSLRIASHAGLMTHIANAYTNLGSASGEVYQFRDADQDLARGIAFCVEHDLDGQRMYMQSWRALAQLYLGHWAVAAVIATAVLEHSRSPVSRAMALLALGRLRARRGDPGVSDALDEALELATQTGHLQRLGPVRCARKPRRYSHNRRRSGGACPRACRR